jgi:hypothetical protein
MSKKTDLQDELTSLSVPYPETATVTQLERLLADATKPVLCPQCGRANDHLHRGN